MVNELEQNKGFRLPFRGLLPGGRRRLSRPERKGLVTASVSSSLADNMSSAANRVPTKPASDVIAGAVARAASQSTIHPIDTMKVRMQTQLGKAKSASRAGSALKQASGISKMGRLLGAAKPGARSMSGGGAVSIASGQHMKVLLTAGRGVADLYKGVFGAASGAGIAIGAYFAFYGMASNVISRRTKMNPGAVAFVAGATAAAGSSVVKVPLAVCIRSVQAGVYNNVFDACNSIVRAAGPGGLFTGYFPTLLEDVPDMAFKFAAYESLRQVHRRWTQRQATAQEDFAMGACAGAFAAAATTPLDVIKTNMMCSAASRPTMMGAARTVVEKGGVPALFRGIGARAASNGINSAVFFCFFEALRGRIAAQNAKKAARAKALASEAHAEAVPA